MWGPVRGALRDVTSFGVPLTGYIYPFFFLCIGVKNVQLHIFGAVFEKVVHYPFLKSSSENVTNVTKVTEVKSQNV